MQNRDATIIELRGGSLGTLNPEVSMEEAFQNNTLRPILKLQNNLLLQVFTHHVKQQKSTFFGLNSNKKEEYIEQMLLRDQPLRNTIKGLIIGMFTLNEYQEYAIHASVLNKRMMGLVTERLKSQMQLLEE
ncbi:glyoxalase [Flavobacterium aciduliphilum]|uniref:Glyoxalase n=1 Tax=Flavobacterium aciduliphilum TaxID=1101402 RepID=A0A328YF63_9FLAO|nr:glyoxalase [Flavobacterium aciduliphilum]RAR71803.1 hypothetical protein CLV55_106154 [Flavobacterium aciduliphilum]